MPNVLTQNKKNNEGCVIMARISWNNPTTGQKAQFVADVFKESLFNYAFDSNKVPSLNLHYFCKDYINSAIRTEMGIIKDGNMVIF